MIPIMDHKYEDPKKYYQYSSKKNCNTEHWYKTNVSGGYKIAFNERSGRKLINTY